MIAQQLDAPGEATMLDVNHWLHMEAFADPTFELAIVSLFLDPFWRQLDDYHEDENVDEEDAMMAALDMTRNYYPDHYSEFGEQYWLLSWREFEAHVHETLMQYMPSTEQIPGNRPDAWHYKWVPVECLGMNFDYFEYQHGMFTSHQMIAFIAMFEMHYDDKKSSIDDFCDDKWVRSKTVDVLVKSLLEETVKQECSIFDNILMLLKWFWNNTGNTFLDYDHDGILEMGMLDWMTWDYVDDARRTQVQADMLMEMVYAGIDALYANPFLLHSLTTNYETVYRSIMAEKQEHNTEGNNVNTTFALTWARPYTASNSGFTSTQRDFRNLRLWRDDAYRDFVLRSQSGDGLESII